MQTHVRQQIREALKALLLGLPTTGSNVFTNRLTRYQDKNLPALEIQTDREDIELLSSMDDFPQDRKLDVLVRVITKDAQALDNVLDTVIKEVEAKLYADTESNTLDNLVKSMFLRSIETQRDGQIAMPVGQAVMVWEVNYFTCGNAPHVSV